MKRRIPFFLVLLIFLAYAATASGSFQGRVVKVTDGDTITVLHNGKTEKIRLAGIDCPEQGQPYGKAAKRFVLDLAAQKIVTVKVETKDRYGRTVGEVILPDGKSLNHELVRAGLAWWYRRYAPNDTVLNNLEANARAAKRGLWAEPNSIPPWEYRKIQRSK